MSESLSCANYPAVLIQARHDQTPVARLKWCHWLLLAYPVLLHLVSRTRSADEALVVDESVKYQIAATMICGLYVTYLFMQSPRSWIRLLFRRPMCWWTIYLIMAIVSASWSAEPLVTTFRAGQAVIFLILIVHAMRSIGSLEDWIMFQLIFGIVLILCATYTFVGQVYPVEGLSIRSLHGWAYPHCLVGIFFIGLPLWNRSWKFVLYTILAVILVSTSAKAYIAFAIGMWFLIYFSYFSNRNACLWAISFVLVVLLLYFPQESLRLFFPGKEMDTILSGHGRLTVWETMAEEFVVERPIHGYGFGIGDKLSYISDGLSFRIAHSHNLILAAMMNLGVVGAVFIILFCLDVAIAGWRSLEQRWRSSSIAGLIAIMFTALFTTSIASGVSSTWLNHTMLLMGFAFHSLSQSSMDDPVLVSTLQSHKT